MSGQDELSFAQNQRRDPIKIMADVLYSMQEPRKLTHICYQSGMNHSQIVRYMGKLVDMGFAEEKKEPFRTYCATDDGKKFMKLIRSGASGSDLSLM